MTTKKTQGRPKLPKKQVKSAKLSAPCTDGFLVLVDAKAKKLGLTRADFIREAVASWL